MKRSRPVLIRALVSGLATVALVTALAFGISGKVSGHTAHATLSMAAAFVCVPVPYFNKC